LNEAKTGGYCVKTLCDSDTKFINLKLKAILETWDNDAYIDDTAKWNSRT